MTGSRKDSSYLTTNTLGGTPESSPIMKRFVSNVVYKHPFYGKRKVSEDFDDVMVRYSKHVAYDGEIIILDENWTYDQLKNSVTYYEKNNAGYYVVDAGEF